ncbi:hypothetical protein ACDT12_13765, partial [Staphylococcus aureus]
NAKLLESVHPSLQSLHSVQSMQCSSGYGTMTNVSSHSSETMQSIAGRLLVFGCACFVDAVIDDDDD